MNAISLTSSAKLCARVFGIYLTPPTIIVRCQNNKNNSLGNELIAAASQQIAVIKLTFIFLRFTNTINWLLRL